MKALFAQILYKKQEESDEKRIISDIDKVITLIISRDEIQRHVKRKRKRENDFEKINTVAEIRRFTQRRNVDDRGVREWSPCQNNVSDQKNVFTHTLLWDHRDTNGKGN